MSDWVKRQVLEIAEVEARRRADRDWSLHADAVICRKAPMIWERLVSCMQKDVEVYNEGGAHPDRQLSFTNQGSQVIIRRTYCPEVRIEVAHDTAAQRITWQKIVTKTCDSEPSLSAGHFRFYLHDTDELYLADAKANPLACDEASKNLLQPVFALWR